MRKLRNCLCSALVIIMLFVNIRVASAASFKILPVQTNVPITKQWVLTFSSIVNPKTVTSSTVYLYTGKTNVALTYTVSKNTITVKPKKSLLNSTTYYLVATSGIKSTTGKILLSVPTRTEIHTIAKPIVKPVVEPVVEPEVKPVIEPEVKPVIEPTVKPVDVEVKEIINVYKIDTDGDGLTDFQEINKYSTDPNKRDTDGDGINDGDWEERKEKVYTLTAVMELRKPYNIESMNDDYQDARIISEENNIIKVEVIMYPYNTINKNIVGSKNWQNTNTDVVKYIQPGITSNWDAKLRKDIIDDVNRETRMNILDNTTDLEVVRHVSNWAYTRSVFLNERFPVDFAVSFDTDSKPYISNRFQRMVDYGNPKPYEWDNTKLYSNFIIGKDMYYNKSHGSCSSYSIYQSTILKAIGIPTRTILTIPSLNGSSEEQKQLIKNNITNKEISNNILNSSKQGIVDHFINEVYINGRWIRLNYSNLGSNTYDRDNGFYLAVHVDKKADFYDFQMDKTWTDRIATINKPGPEAQSYNLISIKEQIAK